MDVSGALSAPAPAPTTNRGVYPHPAGWSASAFDYVRATVGAGVETLLDGLAADLEALGRPVNREPGPAVRHYGSHVVLTDRLGRGLCSVFWGGQNVRANVEAKGANAPLIVPSLRARWEHFPSRLDVKRDARAPGLFRQLRERAGAFAERYDLRLQDWANNHPDMGDTFYLGSRASQAFLRVYQPALKRAQEEGRTGDTITQAERDTARVELQFQPQKRRAKLAAASLAPDEVWGVSPWIADFAGEVFAMDVQPVSISERRESNRNRALRFMAAQYRTHLADLLAECQGDVALFGSTVLDLGDIPHKH